MPTGVENTGTSQASASSTARPNPSRSEGTSTALAALTHSGTAAGLDVAESQQLAHVAGDGLGAVVALLGPSPGRRGTAGSGPLDRARAGARVAPSRSGGSDRCRRRTGAPPVAPANGPRGNLPRQRLARPSPRGPMVRSPASVIAPRAGVAEIGAVQRHGPRPRAGPRAPARSRVRSGSGRRRSARRGSRVAGLRAARVYGGSSGREREHLDLDPVDPSQRLHLIADEAAERRLLRRRVHVRHDQRAHRCERIRAGRLWHHLGMPVSAADPVGGIRLRRRRLDRPPRAAGVAADRGLPVPRRHRTVPVRQPHAGGARSSSRSRSPTICWKPARSCWWSRATRPARRRSRRSSSTSPPGLDVDVIGVVAPATQLAVAGSRIGPDRAAGDAGDGRQRRL